MVLTLAERSAQLARRKSGSLLTGPSNVALNLIMSRAENHLYCSSVELDGALARLRRACNNSVTVRAAGAPLSRRLSASYRFHEQVAAGRVHCLGSAACFVSVPGVAVRGLR